MKKLKTVISILALAGAGVVNAENTVRDLNEYSCRDILVASGEERDLAVMFLQGYFLGKSGKTSFDRDKLAEATDKMIDLCLDETNANLVETMGRALKAVYGS